MTRTLLIVSCALFALVAIALAAPEPKDQKSHAAQHRVRPHRHGHAKSRKPRSAGPATYESGYPVVYQPGYYNGNWDANQDYYYGQIGRYGRRGPGRRIFGGRWPSPPPAGRRGPAFYPLHDYPLYPYQYLYPNYPQYYDSDTDYANRERVKKDAEEHRVKKDTSSLLDKIGNVFKSVKQ